MYDITNIKLLLFAKLRHYYTANNDYITTDLSKNNILSITFLYNRYIILLRNVCFLQIV